MPSVPQSYSSKATKKRYVINQLLQGELVIPTAEQLIARVVKSRGSNLHEVESSVEDEENFLVSIPTKFRQTVWIRRGQFVVLEPIVEGDKVKAEICHVLSDENVLHLREKGLWPAKYVADAEAMTRQHKRGLLCDTAAATSAAENDGEDDIGTQKDLASNVLNVGEMCRNQGNTSGCPIDADMWPSSSSSENSENDEDVDDEDENDEEEPVPHENNEKVANEVAGGDQISREGRLMKKSE